MFYSPSLLVAFAFLPVAPTSPRIVVMAAVPVMPTSYDSGLHLSLFLLDTTANEDEQYVLTALPKSDPTLPTALSGVSLALSDLSQTAWQELCASAEVEFAGKRLHLTFHESQGVLLCAVATEFTWAWATFIFQYISHRLGPTVFADFLAWKKSAPEPCHPSPIESQLLSLLEPFLSSIPTISPILWWSVVYCQALPTCGLSSSTRAASGLCHQILGSQPPDANYVDYGGSFTSMVMLFQEDGRCLGMEGRFSWPIVASIWTFLRLVPLDQLPSQLSLHVPSRSQSQSKDTAMTAVAVSDTVHCTLLPVAAQRETKPSFPRSAVLVVVREGLSRAAEALPDALLDVIQVRIAAFPALCAQFPPLEWPLTGWLRTQSLFQAIDCVCWWNPERHTAILEWSSSHTSHSSSSSLSQFVHLVERAAKGSQGQNSPQQQLYWQTGGQCCVWERTPVVNGGGQVMVCGDSQVDMLQAPISPACLQTLPWWL